MIVSIKHKGLKLFFESGDTSKISQDHIKRLKLILTQLQASKNIKDMNFPGSKLHQLVGDKKYYWSVSVSGNWRVIFRFENGDAYDVDYVDYH